MRDPLHPTRRDILVSLLGAPLAAAACRKAPPPRRIEGEIVGGSVDFGHALRAKREVTVPPDAWTRTGVVIVGAGIAGLSAAWQFERSGYRDYVVLELEKDAGGTSASGHSGVSPFPWGAHYLPVPLANNESLIALLDEMGLLEGRRGDGSPIVKEEHLCRDPQERVFYRGRWAEGLYLHAGASAEDLRQLASFKEHIGAWVAFRDDLGRRAFAIPRSHSSDHEKVRALDTISMAEYLDARGLDSPRLRWFVEYACRDDYGTMLEKTSAWAGIFYFASRLAKLADEDEPLITWPEGNGRFVKHFANKCEGRVRTSTAALRIRDSGNGVEVIAAGRDGKIAGFRASRVIFAAQQFLRPYLIESAGGAVAAPEGFEYSPWLVANLTLRDRFPERDFPLAWDNVFYESRSLGYVCATHQRGVFHGPTVLTWYYALCHDAPGGERRRLLDLGWREWADVILADMRLAHPQIDDLTLRVDMMRWGHAMVSPSPGFMFGDSLRRASEPVGRIHFANSDLSGLALLEEAFDHGTRAANEVLRAMQQDAPAT
ncbi:MAG: FAD-dependent oxidoreductase [Thermoanaerobaculia bacterium]|nr:FAD-dependent oxidoreductase [Thermoanaerobaculia bacterium]